LAKMGDIENLVVKKHFDTIIANDTSADFLFDQIREDWKKSDRMFNVQPYSHLTDGSLDFLKEANVTKPVAAPQKRGVQSVDSLNNTQGRSNSTQDYLKPNDILANYSKIIINHLNNGANKILKETREKREKILDVFIANPFVPRSERFLYSINNATQGNVALFYLLMCFVFPVYLVYCLVDVSTGTTNAARGSPKEKEWLESTMLAHPQLETTAINQRISEELQNMAATLGKLYTQASYGMLTTEENRDSKRYQKFILRIQPKIKGGSSAVLPIAPSDVKVSVEKTDT